MSRSAKSSDDMRSDDRKTLSGLEFAFADRLEFLNAEHWDIVAQHGGILLSREYLSVLDDGGIEDATMRYGLIYRDRKPVACFCTQTLEVLGTQLVRSADQLDQDDRAKLALKRLTRKALEKIHRRVTVCGNFVSWGMDGFAFVDDEQPEQMWQGLTESLYRIRRADKLYDSTDYVVVKDLPEAVKEHGKAFKKQRYRALETEPNMVLPLDANWNNIDDYLADLNKKYRKAARNVLKNVESAKVALTKISDAHEHAEAIYQQYLSVAARADVRLARLSPDYLPNLQERLGDERFAILGLITESGQLLGYVTVIRDGDTAIGYYLGIDYEAKHNLPVYHRLLFAVIEQALEWKCSKISFGRTALEAKARLGCVPEPTFVWVRHRIPLLNLLVNQLIKAVPHDEPPERNPFKASS